MTQDIHVYIDNFRVDIATTSAIQIKRQFKDVKEFSKKKTSFSKPITVLYTQNNAAIFGAAFNINQIGGWDKNSRPIARIDVNGSTVIDGNAKLDSITNSGYQFVVYESKLSLNDTFGDELLKGNSDSSKDISFTNQYAFNFTRPNLRALMQSEPRQDGKGINYGYVDLVDDVLSFKDDRLMLPSLGVRELLEEALLSIGKTATYSTNIEKYLNRLYMPFNGEYKELTNEWQYAEYSPASKDLNRTYKDMNIIDELLCSYDKIQDIAAEATTTRQSILIANNVGEYKVLFKCRVRKTIDNGTSPEVFPRMIVSSTTITPQKILELDVKNTGANESAGIILDLDGFHEATFEATFKLSGAYNALYIGFDTNELPDGGGLLEIESDGSSTIKITKLDSFYNEDSPNVITADKVMPLEYKKKDLFNDVLTFFNAIATEKDNNIHITTNNEFDKERDVTIKDWSDKLHDDSSLELSTLASEKSEIIEFKFSDSDDLYNEDYRTKYNSSISNILEVNETKTVVSKTLNIASSNIIDLFTSLANADGEFNTKLKPRFLFIDSYIHGIISGRVFGLDIKGARNTDINYLHILSGRFSLDETTEDNVVISFKNEDTYSSNPISFPCTNGTIYNMFYKRNYELTTNDDLIFLRSKFNLTPKDFSELKFNDIIFVSTEMNGGMYCRVNEVSGYYIGLNRPTTIELVQIDLSLLDSEDVKSESIELNKVTLSADGLLNADKLSSQGAYQ